MNFFVTTEEYQNLMKGRQNTGKGGTPLSEILENGHPLNRDREKIPSEGEYKSNECL